VDWDGFAAALAHELQRLGADTVLVIPDVERPHYFAQFAQTGTELRAEAASNLVLPEYARLDPHAEQVLADAGWSEPVGLGDRPNWWVRVSWPARSTEYRRLAALAVVALRDAYGVPEPSRLGYRAWVNGSLADVDLPNLGIDRIEG
jgi:hypothetical protein